jgi:hypothetical protein
VLDETVGTQVLGGGPGLHGGVLLDEVAVEEGMSDGSCRSAWPKPTPTESRYIV